MSNRRSFMRVSSGMLASASVFLLIATRYEVPYLFVADAPNFFHMGFLRDSFYVCNCSRLGALRAMGVGFRRHGILLYLVDGKRIATPAEGRIIILRLKSFGKREASLSVPFENGSVVIVPPCLYTQSYGDSVSRYAPQFDCTCSFRLVLSAVAAMVDVFLDGPHCYHWFYLHKG